MSIPSTSPQQLLSYLPEELAQQFETWGEKPYRAAQVFQWVHKHRCLNYAQMGNVPAALREQMAAHMPLSVLNLNEARCSEEDGTEKLVFKTHDGGLIESVLIPMKDKYTQCLSSQIGCTLDCKFCQTGRMGLGRNLTAGEIVEQVILACNHLGDKGNIRNLVFMGMGEPLANYANVIQAIKILKCDDGLNFSGRKITVSTAGMVPAIEKLGIDVQVNLAISLNATTDSVRDEIMPINQKFNLEKLMEACRNYPLSKGRRITFEYCLLAGINDTLEDADRIVKLVRGIDCKINVLAFNEHPQAPYKRPHRKVVDAFCEQLYQNNKTVTYRESRGRDIGAACGQLGKTPEQRMTPARFKTLVD